MNQKWFWCPKCMEAVPQLSPKHYKGECHCEEKAPVDMVLLDESDPRVQPTLQKLNQVTRGRRF